MNTRSFFDYKVQELLDQNHKNETIIPNHY